jgi:hypothetical protein
MRHAGRHLFAARASYADDVVSVVIHNKLMFRFASLTYEFYHLLTDLECIHIRLLLPGGYRRVSPDICVAEGA